MADSGGRFTPARLSPVPVKARACPLPYGLTWDELRVCLPGFTAAAGARAWVSHAIQGLHGERNSRILTLRYLSTERSPRTQTLFFKQVADPTEAAKVRFLSSRGVPTPRLLQAVSRGHRAVLLFEFLPTIGIEPGEADQLITLIARVNAVERPPLDLFQPRLGAPPAQFDARVEAALALLANDPTVPVAVDSRSWFQTYKRVEEAVAEMPVALNHGELYFQHVGWSAADSGRRLVMFDMETAALLPRFTDIAGVLNGLSAQTGREERELFAGYLHALRRHTGIMLDESQALTEMRLVRIISSFQSLPWLAEMAGHPDLDSTPASAARAIHNDLKALDLAG
jgi:hypothetical protein